MVSPDARLTVTLPRTLYRQIKFHALDQDVTMQALMIKLIRTALEAQP